MENDRKSGKIRLPLLIGAGLWLVYVVLAIFAPKANNYHLTALQYALVQLTIFIPLLFIWTTAIYGAIRFKDYAQLIKGSRDGIALNYITNGLLLVASSFIAQTFLGILPRYAHPLSGLQLTLVFLHNTIPAVLSVLAFWSIYKGSVGLSEMVKFRKNVSQFVIIGCLYGVFSVLFSWYFVTHISHVMVNNVPNFALPGEWPYLTIGLPYLFSWLLGLVAIINLTGYIVHVKGSIYRLALRYLAAGIMAVMAFALVFQLLILATSTLSRLDLPPLLAVLYLILIAYAFGFILIALGAKKLTRIEAVR